jgi:hypothetical protein
MSKLAQASFCCTNTHSSKVGTLQPCAQDIPHNGISSSHNGIIGLHWTGSAPRGHHGLVLEFLVLLFETSHEQHLEKELIKSQALSI